MLWRFEVEREGQKQRAFQKAKAPLHPVLGFIGLQQFSIGEGLGIERVRGQDKATVLTQASSMLARQAGQGLFDPITYALGL